MTLTSALPCSSYEHHRLRCTDTLCTITLHVPVTALDHWYLNTIVGFSISKITYKNNQKVIGVENNYRFV